MYSFNIFCHFALLCCFSSASFSQHLESLQWVDSTKAYLSHLEPAGYDSWTKSDIYVARARMDGDWIAGKAKIYENVFRGWFPFMGREVNTTSFQVLMSPPGTTSWVKTRQGASRSSMTVVADNETVTYICRGLTDTSLQTGMVDGNTGTCKISHRNSVTTFTQQYEILVVSEYGRAKGVSNHPITAESSGDIDIIRFPIRNQPPVHS